MDRIYIIYTKIGPFRAYDDGREAYREHRRLQNLSDLVDYSIVSLPIQKEVMPNDGGIIPILPLDSVN